MQNVQHAPGCGGLTMVHWNNSKSIFSEHGVWGKWDWETTSENLARVLLENPLW